MPNKTSIKSTKVAKKAAAKRVVAKPTLLTGGNPQIAKADGDAIFLTGTLTVFIASRMAGSSQCHQRVRPSVSCHDHLYRTGDFLAD
jgi:hypothetical protein